MKEYKLKLFMEMFENMFIRESIKYDMSKKQKGNGRTLKLTIDSSDIFNNNNTFEKQKRER